MVTGVNYGVGSTLRAVGFDLDRLAVTTNAVPSTLGALLVVTGGYLIENAELLRKTRNRGWTRGEHGCAHGGCIRRPGLSSGHARPT